MNPDHLAHDEELLDRSKAERAGDRMLPPFQLFAKQQASGSLVRLACAVVALAWANSPWASAYEQMLGVPLGISIGEHTLALALRDWINDGLMPIFFFGVGLEIKREFLVGELADPRTEQTCGADWDRHRSVPRMIAVPIVLSRSCRDLMGVPELVSPE